MNWSAFFLKITFPFKLCVSYTLLRTTLMDFGRTLIFISVLSAWRILRTPQLLLSPNQFSGYFFFYGFFLKLNIFSTDKCSQTSRLTHPTFAYTNAYKLGFWHDYSIYVCVYMYSVSDMRKLNFFTFIIYRILYSIKLLGDWGVCFFKNFWRW